MTDAQIAAYKRKLRYDANPEKHKKYAIAWAEANKKKVKGYQKAYYLRTKAEHIARAVAWQAANPERWKQIQKDSYARRSKRVTA